MIEPRSPGVEWRPSAGSMLGQSQHNPAVLLEQCAGLDALARIVAFPRLHEAERASVPRLARIEIGNRELNVRDAFDLNHGLLLAPQF